MKKVKLGIVIIAIVFAITGNTTVWHVNNNDGVVTDFTSLQQAHDDAGVANGDTLYVYGSTGSYGSLTMTKQLTVIGPGYFLNENPETQVNSLNASAEIITINSSASNSLITGLKSRHIYSYATDVLIFRNRVTPSSTYEEGIDIYSNGNIVKNNYIYAVYGGAGIDIHNSVSYSIIANNILDSYYTNDNSLSIRTHSNVSNVSIINNVLKGKISLYNSDLRNNILYSGSFDDHGCCTFYNNISNSDQFGSDNGNQDNVDMETVFVGTGSTDGQWQLADGSPAIGAGYNGEDCGAYGGDTPYKLSGIPSEIPAIYLFSAPAVGFDLPIEIKAKSHN